MNPKQKGDERERQARKILESKDYVVETPNSTPYPQPYGVDFFGLFDIIAFKTNKKPRLIQVKSNGARGIRSFPEECNKMKVPWEFVTVEYWVCYDKEGWRILSVNNEGHEEVLDERDIDMNMGEYVKQELENITE